MAKKAKDENVVKTTSKKVTEEKINDANIDTVDTASEKKDVVNLEKQDNDNKKDVSEVVTPNDEQENPEKIDQEQESLNTTDKPCGLLNETIAPCAEEQLNEVVSNESSDDKKLNEEFSGQVDGPIVEGDLSGELAGMQVSTVDMRSFGKPSLSEYLDNDSAIKSFVACPPVEATYVPEDTTPVYIAQCPPKPVEEYKEAYVAQRPY